ncbi:MAG: HU family DNA-binding protein [Desulfovibrionaceae bacterium]|nr:HU family DNA-binding protein [Desulfovibrionaceae bacterium]
MTKDRVVSQMQRLAGLATKAEAEKALEAILSSIREGLDRGEPVIIRPFGTFRVVKRAARKGRNPRTGQSLDIPARNQVRFQPGQGLKQSAAYTDWPAYLNAQLGEIKSALDKYAAKAKAGELGAEAKSYAQAKIKRLASGVEEARARLKQLSSHGGEALGEIGRGLENAFAELKAAFRKAKDKF